MQLDELWTNKLTSKRTFHEYEFILSHIYFPSRMESLACCWYSNDFHLKKYGERAALFFFLLHFLFALGGIETMIVLAFLEILLMVISKNYWILSFSSVMMLHCASKNLFWQVEEVNYFGMYLDSSLFLIIGIMIYPSGKASVDSEFVQKEIGAEHNSFPILLSVQNIGEREIENESWHVPVCFPLYFQDVMSNHKESLSSSYGRMDTGLRSSYSQLSSSSYPSNQLSSSSYPSTSLPSQPYSGGYGSSSLGGYSTFRLWLGKTRD